jgi:putative flippase GtrA
MHVAVVIPAYQPGPELLQLIRQLVETPLQSIVVIDDGSGAAWQSVFDEVRSHSRVTLLRHGVNLGKGAALKTGINQVVCEFSSYAGVVTADADGQHDIDDIVSVAGLLESHPGSLILGSRQFEQTHVPWTNRFGNLLTRRLLRWIVGQDLADTQTGLRAIPMKFMQMLLRVPSSGYEFELDMLIVAKHHRIAILEHPIKTIYQAGNPTSHFNPLLDSLKIYFVLLRFTAVALTSALLDNGLFVAVFRMSGNVIGSQVAARAVSCSFNYAASRKAVFLSRGSHANQLPRYLLNVVCSTAISYILITFLTGIVGSVIAAKLIAESVLFLFNFAIQRDFVFRNTAPTAGE